MSILNIFYNFVFQNFAKMGLPELKNKIQQQVESADEKILKIVSSVFDNYYNDEGTTDSIINELLEISENDYKEGLTEPYTKILKESKAIYFGK
jgi:uncharacterized protein YpuA (DUF1002 family)